MWNPFKKKSTSTVVLKDAMHCIERCPDPNCGQRTQIVGHMDGNGNVEVMEQLCIMCGTIRTRLSRKRPEFELDEAGARRMFGG
jgi:hypothetical protein